MTSVGGWTEQQDREYKALMARKKAGTSGGDLLSLAAPAQPFVSQLGGAFVHEFVGKQKVRDWILKGVLTARCFALVIGAPGCIDGGATISFEVRYPDGHRRTIKKLPLETLFHKFHRIKYRKSKQVGCTRGIVPRECEFYTQSVMDDGRIFMNRIVDIFQSGMKECFRVTLSDGRSLLATSDHRFLCASGYVELAKLKAGDAVFAHSHKVKNTNKGSRRLRAARKMFYVSSHPVARTKKITGTNYSYKVLPRSRAVVEADMNGMALEDYIALLNTGCDLSGMKFLPKKDDIHHKNEDFTDDRLENLEVISHADHAAHHSRGSLHYMAEPVVIASIERAGEKMTYDIEMAGAYKNFMVNEIAVHNCGKSFLILDLMMHVALCVVKPDMKREWFGRKIKPCGVAYIAAEGQEDFEFRIQAFCQHHQIEREKFPFYLIPTAVDLCVSQDGTKKLIDEIKGAESRCRDLFDCGFEIVVVDTVSRAMGGGDENSSQAMGTFVKNCGAVKDACEIAVIGVHHTPQGGERARGHGALHGATDAEIFVTGAHDGRPNRWKVTRVKCGPAGAWHEFRLRQHFFGKDEDGDDITSCVVHPEGGEGSMEEAYMRDNAEAAKTGKRQFTEDGRAILPDNITATVQALQTAVTEIGEEPPVGVRVPHGRRAVPEKAWLDELVRLVPLKSGEEREGDSDAAKKFRKRCWDIKSAATLKLTRKRIIGTDSGWVWRTERRVASVDAPLNSENRQPFSENAPPPPEPIGFAGAMSGEAEF